MRRTRVLTAAVVSAALGAAAQAQQPDPRVAAVEKRISELAPYTKLPPCKAHREEARWTIAGTPDKGRARPLISAHRGGNTLAPENTLAAYEAAFGLGVDFIEVDVRQTKDGVLVANHDDTVDRTTNGTGKVADLTLAQLKALNAADYAPWNGGPYDPSRIATLEEVLALAKKAGAGLELDIKIGGAPGAHDRIAGLVARYGLTDKSIFNSQSPDTLKSAPGALLIYNRNSWEPPSLLFDAAKTSRVFGSRLAEYSPESIVAIHDNCGLVMPHAYDEGGAREAAQFLAARAIGADGVQTNQPELIVATAGLTVATRLNKGQMEDGAPAICLVNAKNGMGVLGKHLTLSRKGEADVSLVTVQHGCERLPPGVSGWTVRFEGDAAVGAAGLSG